MSRASKTPFRFSLEPVPPFRLDLTVWTLRRRAENAVDRWDGRTYRRVLPLTSGAVEVAVCQAGSREAPRLDVEVRGAGVGPDAGNDVRLALERLLGVRIDLAPFYEFAERDKRLGPLVERFRGMKPPRFLSVFEALANAIACQQLTLTYGIGVLNRLAQVAGPPFAGAGGTVHAFPRPADLAALDPTALRPLGFSRMKAESLLAIAREISSGTLDLEILANEPDEAAIRSLCSLRGVGSWSAEYSLLRGLGRTHVFPAGDVGARNNLQRWLGRTEPFDSTSVLEALAPWRPYAGLLYFHMLLHRLEETGALSAEATH